MRRRVAQKISRRILALAIERVTADLPLFPAHSWAWRRGYRLGTLYTMNRRIIRDLRRNLRTHALVGPN